jgi:preprotein translocase subunit SecG
MLFALLLVVNILICIALICVVLLQQSEGGALGMGGGPSGFMTARGAGDLLTRTTWILASAFIVLSMGLTLLQARQTKAANSVNANAVGNIDVSRFQTPAPGAATTPAAPPPTTTLPAAPAPATTGSSINLQAPAPSLGLPPAPATPATK